MPENEKADQRVNADRLANVPNHENKGAPHIDEAAKIVKPAPTTCDTCGKHRRDCARWYNSVDRSRGWCSVACWPTNNKWGPSPLRASASAGKVTAR